MSRKGGHLSQSTKRNNKQQRFSEPVLLFTILIDFSGVRLKENLLCSCFWLNSYTFYQWTFRKSMISCTGKMFQNLMNKPVKIMFRK